jgi:hypothetical protein
VPYHKETYSGTEHLKIAERYTAGFPTVVCEMQVRGVLSSISSATIYLERTPWASSRFRNAGFQARSAVHPEQVLTLPEWLALSERP